MKILVTGGEGQLANSLKDIFSGKPNVDAQFFVKSEWDITNFELNAEMVKTHQPDFLINTAAYTAVEQAEEEYEKSDKINHLAVGNLAKISLENSCKLIQISTDYVFDGMGSGARKEEDPCFPLSQYGRSKRNGELAILGINSDAIIIRTSWLYSNYGRNFYKTIIRLAKEKEELTIVSDQVSAPTFAGDLADCILKMVELNTSKNIQGLFHFSNEGEASWYDFANAIVETSNSDVQIKKILSKDFPQKAKRPAFSKLNSDKLKQDLNIYIPDWRDGLTRCWENKKEDLKQC